MTSPAFAELYEKLNQGQKKAVDTIEGPVMVIAGPGTGKTQVLTLRIANILLKTDTAPEQILALTFTESGVAAMRKRLAAIIGAPAYRVTITTFHSFCDGIIKMYPEYFPRIIGSRPITEVTQVGIIEKIVDAGDLKLLRPWGDPHLYVRSILSAISDLKREGVVPRRFETLVAEAHESVMHSPDLYHEKGAHKGKMKSVYVDELRRIEKNKELALVYGAYEKALAENRQYDFNDMIVEVLLALVEHEPLLRILQENYQYFLIDEHQDTNNAQNKIIELLVSFHDQPNLFVVGDEKQAIFRFQGASLENFYYFRDRFPGAIEIPLVENYRSTGSILSVADSLLVGPEKLRSQTAAGAPLKLYGFSSFDAEHFFLAQDVKERIAAGTLPEEIAVLYRSNREAFAVAEALKKNGVPVSIESDGDLLSDRDVATLLSLLRTVAFFGNDTHLVPVLHNPLFGIDPLDAYRLIRVASQKRIYNMFDMLYRPELLEEVKAVKPDSITALADLLSMLRDLSAKETLPVTFERAFEASGLLKTMLASPAVSNRLEAIGELFQEVRLFAEENPKGTLADFFSYLETVEAHGLFIKKTAPSRKAGMVRLMTAHRSKGLEFDIVYIIHATAGIWGDRKDRELLPLIPEVYKLREGEDSFDTDAQNDERRLFYVALTRARKEIILTYSATTAQGREAILSPFVHEIEPSLIETVATEAIEARFKKEWPSTLSNKKNSVPEKDISNGYVKELFDSQGFSVSALNNFLECPWKYFYQNLLRIPVTPSMQQYYGQAMHAAVDAFFKRRVAEETDAEFLVNRFKSAVLNLPITERDTNELLLKGERALRGWYEESFSDISVAYPVKTEFRINGVLLDDVKLTGVLDRIDFIGGNDVHVIDYKTGKPKSRNDIEGKTKTSNGNYYRQLVFYKLLLSLYDNGKYEFKSGELNFLEPDEKGKYKKEVFEVPDEDVEDLKVTIKESAEKIRNFAFAHDRCDTPECGFCSLRNLMSLEE